MGALNRQGVHVVHATGSRSFTQTLRDNVERVDPQARRSFSYFNSYTHATTNDLDVLLCDEAHRLRETSRKRDTRNGYDDGRQAPPQVQELINATQVPVFLLDEHQLVRRGEVGSVQLSHDTATAMGVKVHQIDLRHQFRCGGCPEYVTWIENLLGLGSEQGSAAVWHQTIAAPPATKPGSQLSVKLDQAHLCRSVEFSDGLQEGTHTEEWSLRV
ncbi:DNA/RNA helicase domain-containing protein [Sphaerisporangium sp. NPDC005289]|uniref:DNA/RNA helicase domain-containing protein n=1 Tax=Sphaerisporangium sp. NPDC005289 TaxID=3155247 RepID=UPI0033AFB452